MHPTVRADRSLPAWAVKQYQLSRRLCHVFVLIISHTGCHSGVGYAKAVGIDLAPPTR